MNKHEYEWEKFVLSGWRGRWYRRLWVRLFWRWMNTRNAPKNQEGIELGVRLADAHKWSLEQHEQKECNCFAVGKKPAATWSIETSIGTFQIEPSSAAATRPEKARQRKHNIKE